MFEELKETMLDYQYQLHGLINYILYLEKLTGITNKLGLKGENIND